jgi:hypothetical protein
MFNRAPTSFVPSPFLPHVVSDTCPVVVSQHLPTCFDYFSLGFRPPEPSIFVLEPQADRGFCAPEDSSNQQWKRKLSAEPLASSSKQPRLSPPTIAKHLSPVMVPSQPSFPITPNEPAASQFIECQNLDGEVGIPQGKGKRKQALDSVQPCSKRQRREVSRVSPDYTRAACR